jgi:pSer/pThr/pTyr-binding forkhead associated (FHA) protein
MTSGTRRIITVGRVAEGNDMQVHDDQNAYISRRHCTLERHEGQYIIRDGQWNREAGQWQQSQNGTYVGSTEVTQLGLQLRPGDIITIGDTTLKFEQ